MKVYAFIHKNNTGPRSQVEDNTEILECIDIVVRVGSVCMGEINCLCRNYYRPFLGNTVQNRVMY